MSYFSAKHYLVLSSLSMLLCMYPAMASARLSGEVSLNYTDYSISNDQNNHLSTHSWTQEYSLIYSKQGPIYNSRLGKYEVSLGYNWSAFDTQTSSTSGNDDSSASRGHFIYSGEVLVDPKEVPLRLTAYSRDMNRNTFTRTESGVTNVFLSSVNGGLLGDPNIANGLNDGMHIDSGAILIAGVKSGMTNGYNEVLRHFPMIMLDYRDLLDRDLRSQSPVDTRLSRLAFVSLNKKDNWFHYRYITFNDNINPSNDYQESQIQLGTIDQTQARRWVDFANWLQVSTDLQLTRHTGNSSFENFEQIDLNLFGQARKSNWEARTFSNFNRYRVTDGMLTYSTSLPLYVSGSLNPNFSWSTRASYRDVHNNDGAYQESLLAGYRIDTYKQSPFTLNHNLDVESSRAESSDQLVLSGGLETTSTGRFSRLYSLAASYNIKNSAQNNSSGSSNFLDQRLSLSASYTPSNYVRVMLRQSVELTNGTNQSFASSVRDTSTTLPQYVAPRYGDLNMTGSGAHSFHSLTSLMTSWTPRARLNVYLSATEDLYSASGYGSSNITTVSTSVDYSNAKIRLSDSLSYTNGSSYQSGPDATTISNSASLSYTHNRNLDSRLGFTYNRLDDQSVVSYNYEVVQQLNYNHFNRSGISRKLFEVNEMVTYSNSPYQASNTATNYKNVDRGTLSIGFKYYPLRQFVFSSSARYQFDDSLKNYSLLLYSSLGMNLRIFQASLDYYHGRRPSDGLLEKKFTASLKKQF